MDALHRLMGTQLFAALMAAYGLLVQIPWIT